MPMHKPLPVQKATHALLKNAGVTVMYQYSEPAISFRCFESFVIPVFIYVLI